VLPRAWVVPELRAVRAEQVVDTVLAEDFDPRRHAVVSGDDAAEVGIHTDPACRGRQVVFEHQDSKRLNLRVGDGPPGYLVVSDTLLPGWTVEVNGQPARMIQANVYQRLVPLPARECSVAFRYRTPGLVLGLVLSALAALACTALLWVALRARRGPQPAARSGPARPTEHRPG